MVHGHAVDELRLVYPADRALVVLIFEHRFKVLEGDAVLENEFAVLDVLMNFVSRGKGRALTGHVIFLNGTTLLLVCSTAVFTSTDPLRGLSKGKDNNVIVLLPE